MLIDVLKDGYYIIRPNMRDESEFEFVPSTTEPGLPLMQKTVGGYIEVVYLYRNEKDPLGIAHMVINEEGKLEGKDPNLCASRIAWHGNGTPPDDIIVGDAMVLCGKARMT